MNNAIRWNPIREMMNLRSDIERLFDESFGPSLLWQEPGEWGLALDVIENQDGFCVKASVPGINPDDLDITLTDNVLTISGSIKADETDENEQYHLRERRYGNFRRSVRFPLPVQSDAVEASYEHGILTLQVPKVEEVKPKRITVRALSNGHGQNQKTIEGEVVSTNNS